MARVASRERAALWRERVTRWRASGKSAREFCESEGLSKGSLLAWASRIGREDQPAFARVEVRAPVSPAPSSFEVVLRGGRTLRVVGTPDEATLRTIILLLEGCP